MGTIAIAIVQRAITIEREIKERSKEIIPKKVKKKENYNFTKNNREKSNIVCRMIN